MHFCISGFGQRLEKSSATPAHQPRWHPASSSQGASAGMESLVILAMIGTQAVTAARKARARSCLPSTTSLWVRQVRLTSSGVRNQVRHASSLRRGCAIEVINVIISMLRPYSNLNTINQKRIYTFQCPGKMTKALLNPYRTPVPVY